MTTEQIQFAIDCVQKLVPAAVCEYTRVEEFATGRTVHLHVNHPKRGLTPDTFMRAGKKFNMASYGTRSATGRHHIVAYVNFDANTELKVSIQADGAVNVEVRTKI